MAPSVPASGCAVVVASDRSHRRDGPSPEATKTICRPSGESANENAGTRTRCGIVGGGRDDVERAFRTARVAASRAGAATREWQARWP